MSHDSIFITFRIGKFIEAKIDLWLQGLLGGRNWELPLMTLGFLSGVTVVSI